MFRLFSGSFFPGCPSPTCINRRRNLHSESIFHSPVLATLPSASGEGISAPAKAEYKAWSTELPGLWSVGRNTPCTAPPSGSPRRVR